MKFCIKASFSEYFIVSLISLFAIIRSKRAMLAFPVSDRKTMSYQQEGECVLIGSADACALYLD